MATTKIELNQTIPSVTKTITQEKINQFESCGLLHRENIHNDPEVARRRLGTSYPIASGRMSLTFTAESLRRFFGPEVFNHTGTLNLKFLRPVKSGDTITVHGTVKQRQDVENGTRIIMDVYCENQNGDKTAIGEGTAIVP